MTRGQWLLRRLDERATRMLITVVALSLLAGVLYVDGCAPRRLQLQAVQDETATLRRNLAAEPAAAPAARPLPAVDALPDALRDLQQLAARNGIAFVRASYRLEREDGLFRYRISTELENPYAAVRAFLNGALRQFPTLSLDRLEIQRGADPRAPHTLLELSFHFVPATGGAP